jgi:hypothetical protein
MPPAISVLMPSRGRPEPVTEAIASLRGNATLPLAVEFIIGCDPDDPATAKAARAAGASVLKTAERYGYSRLHEYVNRLAVKARGEWLLLFNDDARMLTSGWDQIVRDPQHARAAVLFPGSNHPPALNCFPIVNRRMTELLGHVSLSPHYDSWVSEVAAAAGLERRIPVQVLHDRADLTGGHDDQTRAESQGQYRTGEYHSPGMRAARARDVDVLRARW